MPYRPKKPCRHPGCVNLTNETYCIAHQRLYSRSAKSRGYNSRWQRVRREYLKHHPLCVSCKAHGKLTKATVVDHIIPHRGDDNLMWDEKNFQALCKPCHDKKTGRYDANPQYKY